MTGEFNLLRHLRAGAAGLGDAGAAGQFPGAAAAARLGLYRLVWHRPLFDLALFVILLGIVAAIGNRILA